LIETNGPDSEEIRKCLTILPANGELQSIHDRNAQHHQVQVIINTKKELTVKDLPILKCQITEPQTNEGTIIANIPIKISFKAVFSK
jgi:hydrocephalus-inducing protein